MKLYTKCNRCEEELSFDSTSSNVDNGVVINEEVLCLKCLEKESKELLESKQKILNKIGLSEGHRHTRIKDNVLYIVTDIGGINRDYYGIDEYTLVTNTLTGGMSICKDGEEQLELDITISIGALTNIIKVMKFMCD
jgi:hypothetical protein